jgi:hypothetical protein
MEQLSKTGLAITALALSAIAMGSPQDLPDDMAVDAQKAEFSARLTSRFSADERQQIIDECLAGTHGGVLCGDWFSNEAWYGLGLDTCKALEAGYSRKLILRDLLPPPGRASGYKFNQAIFDTAIEVLCPECADKQGCARGQEDSASADVEGGNELGIDPQKDQLFIKSMIKRLPKYQQGDLERLCQTHSERCPLFGFSSFGDSACASLQNGQSRDQIVAGLSEFFDPATSKAIVDTAIEVKCPKHHGAK